MNRPNDSTRPQGAATTSRAVSRRSILKGAATTSAALMAVGVAGMAASAAPSPSAMRTLIVVHWRAHTRFRAADKLYEDTDVAILASLEDRPLILPRSRTFSEVRAIGAERVIARRNTLNEHGLYGFPGPCVPAEADRLRRLERQIREREAEFSWEAICGAHMTCDREEVAAWKALLRQMPMDMTEARQRFRYLLRLHPDADWHGPDLAIVARSFLAATTA